MVRLHVHVVPKASRDEVVGWRGDELQVRVTVAPEGGRANAAVCRVIAEALGVAKSSVRVVRGQTARHKTLEVLGVDDGEVSDAFGPPDASML